MPPQPRQATEISGTQAQHACNQCLQLDPLDSAQAKIKRAPMKIVQPRLSVQQPTQTWKRNYPAWGMTKFSISFSAAVFDPLGL